MDLKAVALSIAILTSVACILHIVAVATNSWIMVRPYYEDFLWKGCYRKSTEIGCDRLPDYKGGGEQFDGLNTSKMISLNTQ